MDTLAILKNTFMNGYATSEINAGTIIVCLLCTTLISAYIFAAYRLLCKRSFYNRNFNLSLIAMAVITAAIILTIQSNIVVSLGMVGALSIVRFRTAVKDPLDLVFLFWSISVGIICGAGYALIAVCASIFLSIIMLIINVYPTSRKNTVLVVNAGSSDAQSTILDTVRTFSDYSKVNARNVSKEGLNMVIEVSVKDETKLLNEVLKIDTVTYASLVESTGDVCG